MDTPSSTPTSTPSASRSITLKLLKCKIKYATDHGRSVHLTDREVRGFSARISPKGRVTWTATKSIGKGRGSMQRVVVGHFPGMSIHAARLAAAQTINRLAKGENVVSEVKAIKRAKVAERQCPTIKEASDDWIAQRPGNPTSRYEQDIRLLFKNQVVPELGVSTRVNEVSKADIRKMLKKRRDSGHNVAARNLFAQLRPFFAWCMHEEYIGVSPCDGVVPPDAAKERQHKLNPEEIVAFWQCATSETNTLGDYYRVLLLTAQRRTEVASMQWCEVNLDRAEWIIPHTKTKNGKEHLVPLSPLVVSILRSVKGERKPTDYVFGKFADAPVSGFSKATREIHEAMLSKLRKKDRHAVVSDWRIHDLRRTAASGMAALEIQPHIIEAILNHTPVKLQRTYQVWALYLYAKEKREALEVWANHLTTLLNPSSNSGNVIYLQA